MSCEILYSHSPYTFQGMVPSTLPTPFLTKPSPARSYGEVPTIYRKPQEPSATPIVHSHGHCNCIGHHNPSPVQVAAQSAAPPAIPTLNELLKQRISSQFAMLRKNMEQNGGGMDWVLNNPFPATINNHNSPILSTGMGHNVSKIGAPIYGSNLEVLASLSKLPNKAFLAETDPMMMMSPIGHSQPVNAMSPKFNQLAVPSVYQNGFRHNGNFSDEGFDLALTSPKQGSFSSLLTPSALSSTPSEISSDENNSANAVIVSGPFAGFVGTPCEHNTHWKRLRAKKGYSHYLCQLCGQKWRKPKGGVQTQQQ